MNKLRSFCELVRLPNLLTAAADVFAGYWLYSRQLEFTPTLAALIIASVCLYASAIVLNDIVDIEIDRNERPDRPLPSGRISLHDARRCFIWLTAIALSSAAVASLLARTTACVADAGLIFFAGLTFNLGVKHTALRPANMAICRTLNLALGMSAFGAITFLPLAAMFLYVWSVTHFGCDEAGVSSRWRLRVGMIGIVASILILGYFVYEPLSIDNVVLVIWIALLFHVGRVALRAVRKPDPANVQYAMKTFILAIIPFDALLAAASHGWPGMIPFAALFLLAVYSGRRIYST